jgi:hypothetical protein
VLVEPLLLALCMAAALSLRPWRMLVRGADHDLLWPLAVLAAVLPWIWWCPGPLLAPLTATLGVHLALLTLGWPLAVLLMGFVGAAGLLTGASAQTVTATVFWCGALPLTLSLAAGAGVRRWFGFDPVAYLLLRCTVVPFASTAVCALLADGAVDRLQRYGEAVPAVIVAAGLAEATITSVAGLLLMISAPRLLATWRPQQPVAAAAAGLQR